MKKIILFLLYIFGFSIVSFFIFQIPHFFSRHHLFFRKRDIVFAVIAGVSCGLIVRFFNTYKNKGEN